MIRYLATIATKRDEQNKMLLLTSHRHLMYFISGFCFENISQMSLYQLLSSMKGSYIKETSWIMGKRVVI